MYPLQIWFRLEIPQKVRGKLKKTLKKQTTDRLRFLQNSQHGSVKGQAVDHRCRDRVEAASDNDHDHEGLAHCGNARNGGDRRRIGAGVGHWVRAPAQAGAAGAAALAEEARLLPRGRHWQRALESAQVQVLLHLPEAPCLRRELLVHGRRVRALLRPSGGQDPQPTGEAEEAPANLLLLLLVRRLPACSSRNQGNPDGSR